MGHITFVYVVAAAETSIEIAPNVASVLLFKLSFVTPQGYTKGGLKM